ncbi:MAG: AbrB/MazE/SpoVT family DNA-binding domain-containing protein [Deltaproteobacteria bacterium]
MQARIQKWGNSLAVRIPKALAAEAHLGHEEVVDLAVEKGKLIIAPIKRRKYSLKQLVSRITNENLHKEDIWGPAVGREVW